VGLSIQNLNQLTENLAAANSLYQPEIVTEISSESLNRSILVTGISTGALSFGVTLMA
jgi:hypothetical protein